MKQMHKPTRHMLRRGTKRRYPGENQAYLLVQWLNQVSDASRKRLAAIIENGKELIALGSGEFPTANINPYNPGVSGSKTAFANFRRAHRLVSTINQLLRGMGMFPRFNQLIGTSWRVSWIHTRNRHRLYMPIVHGSNVDDIPFGESDAMSSLLRLAEQGRLNRLRKCACGQWFYARFNHQRFCAQPCQQRDFRTTDEFRAYRRKYMRTYRTRLAEMVRGSETRHRRNALRR